PPPSSSTATPVMSCPDLPWGGGGVLVSCSGVGWHAVASRRGGGGRAGGQHRQHGQGSRHSRHSNQGIHPSRVRRDEWGSMCCCGCWLHVLVTTGGMCW